VRGDAKVRAMPVDGATLRAWRRSRGWDVPEMARQLRRAAQATGTPIADHDGLIRMIRDRERGRHAFSERYELLYRALGYGDDEPAPPAGGPRLARSLSEAAAASFSGAAMSAAKRAPAAASDLISRWAAAVLPSADVLTAAQAGPGEVSRLEATVEVFRMWDHEHGGGLGRRAAAGQLADIADLLAEPHPGPLRHRLLHAASRLAIIVAHMSADVGLGGHADQYLALALDAAREARDASLGARAASAIARRAIDTGHPREAVTLLRHARASLHDVPPPSAALMYTTEAWASAALGDYDGMAPCLDSAAGLADDAGHVGPAEVAGVAGACYEALAAATTGPERASAAARAEDHVTTALRLREPYYVRSRVLDLAGLAHIRLLQAEPSEAMIVAAAALDAASGLRSQRTARRLHSLAITALDQYPAATAVPAFADAVRTRLPL
jgi:hypothetical protein